MKSVGKTVAVWLGVFSSIVVGTEVKAVAATPVAYVYVQTAAGVVGYAASSTGALTKIGGSPFRTSGLMAGSTGYAFFSVGTTYIHSYALSSNGAIGAQRSQINTQSYSGGKCGPAPSGVGGVLDRTGKFFYNALTDGNFNGGCVAFQTYAIGSGGALTFHGDTETAASEFTGAPVILGNEKFGYVVTGTAHLSGLQGFARQTNGDLQIIHFTETDPSDPGNYYTVGAIAADPTNHLAVTLFNGASEPPSLASYTADGAGNLISTNTNAQLPVLAFNPTMLSVNPNGTLLAAGGQSVGPANEPTLQIYHFSGANPITLYKTLVSTNDIEGVGWDNANHLYAISYTTNRLYVFTVTSTSVQQAPGSPYTISAPTKVFVKPL